MHSKELGPGKTRCTTHNSGPASTTTNLYLPVKGADIDHHIRKLTTNTMGTNHRQKKPVIRRQGQPDNHLHTSLRVCERVLTRELYSSSASCCMKPPRGPCCANWGNSCRSTCEAATPTMER